MKASFLADNMSHSNYIEREIATNIKLETIIDDIKSHSTYKTLF
jgi:hypothetical protein